MKEQFLDAYDREHATTLRVLHNYPADKLELRPHPKLKNARELAWVFVLERYLGESVWNDEIAKRGISGKPPEAPASWDEILGALEKAHKRFRDIIASVSDEALTPESVVLRRPEADGRDRPHRLALVPAVRPDPSPRPVLRIFEDGRGKGACDLRTERRRAVGLADLVSS